MGRVKECCDKLFCSSYPDVCGDQSAHLGLGFKGVGDQGLGFRVSIFFVWGFGPGGLAARSLKFEGVCGGLLSGSVPSGGLG